LATGISFWSSAIDNRSRSPRLATATGTDLLRVMISKSLNLTFSVTVRPRDPLVLAVAPDLVDQRLQFDRHGFEFGEVARERIFRPDRLPDPVRADLPIVDASRDPVVVRAGLAESGLHELQRLIAHVESSVEAERIHLRARRRPDAVEFADGQRLDERRSHLGRDDVLTVRLAVIGREFRQEFVVGNAGGRVEAGHLLDLGPDRKRDVARQRNIL
jgi:hypothetical protein